MELFLAFNPKHLILWILAICSLDLFLEYKSRMKKRFLSLKKLVCFTFSLSFSKSKTQIYSLWNEMNNCSEKIFISQINVVMLLFIMIFLSFVYSMLSWSTFHISKQLTMTNFVVDLESTTASIPTRTKEFGEVTNVGTPWCSLTGSAAVGKGSARLVTGGLWKRSGDLWYRGFIEITVENSWLEN